MIVTIAWVATALILATYALMQRRPAWAHWFNLANGIGAFPLATSAILVGAWPSAAVSIAFGLIGWYGLVRRS